MTRYDTAYLEVEDNTDVGVFQFNLGLSTRAELDKTFLMGPRGQYVTEAFNIFDSIGDIDSQASRRAGYRIDGGAGNYSETIQFETGMEDENITWGDGSGGTGQSNVHPRDASGSGVKPLSRYHVLGLWMTRALTDSRNPARLYWGEWATGDYHASAGAFNQAFPCAVVNYQAEMPDPNSDPPSTFSGIIQLSLTTPFAAYDPPSWMANSQIGTFAESAADSLGDFRDD